MESKNCLNLDLIFLIYSYFSFDEILEVTNNDHKLRDLILERYNPDYPAWDEIFRLNYYNIAKYYIEKGCLPIESSLIFAVDTGNSKMLELLKSSNIKFTTIELNYVASKGKYEIFMYLISQGVNTDDMTYNYFLDKYLNLLLDISISDVNQSTVDFVKIFKYLSKK
jgi:hypothetical protein